ncbi:MAG: hypothetical protein PVH77_10250 [Phycisphaerales bacterium]|jgi:uncharacterized protein YdaU (DUF1376 family)
MKIRFVQLESQAFLTDIDFNMMSPSERGVYCTLICLLNINGGKCEYNPPAPSNLCHCQTTEEFENVWQKISKKFQLRNGIVKHKRVTKELKKAKKFIQHQRKAGLKGAKKRWHGHSDAIDAVIANETKRNVNEKESKYISNTNNQSLSSSNSLRAIPAKYTHIQTLNFNHALTNIIRPRTQSDRTCFRKITNWLMAGCATGKFNEQIFERVLGYAKEASTGRNPTAVLMSLLKKELNYKPGA